jgi:hypothetical protein
MAKVTIVFEDVDLDTGQYKAEMEVEGSRIDDGFMTAAHMTGAFIMTHLSNPAFQRMAMDFAASIASNPGCSIANADHLPDVSNDDTDNAGAAA